MSSEQQPRVVYIGAEFDEATLFRDAFEGSGVNVSVTDQLDSGVLKPGTVVIVDDGSFDRSDVLDFLHQARDAATRVVVMTEGSDPLPHEEQIYPPEIEVVKKPYNIDDLRTIILR